MRRMSRRAVGAVLFTVALWAGPPRAAAEGPSVRVWDWKNGEYDLGEHRYRFVDGRHTELAGGACQVCLNIRDVTFGDVDGDGNEEAILSIATNLGGAGTSLDAYVFGLVGDKPVLRAQIEGGDRGEGGLQSVSVVSGEVVVRRFALAAQDGACCPSRVLVERWRWRHRKLVKQPGGPRVQKRQPRAWYLKP